MTLDLYREVSTPQGTFGRLGINGEFVCWTLEDIVRAGPKIVHETAIPAGIYQVVITRSQRFEKMLPLVQNVPDFTAIRIHSGTTSADTSGCILVGLKRDAQGVWHSKLAMEVLLPLLADALARGQQVWLTVHPAFPAGTFRA